jgi:signal transduction histidine kinase
MKGRCLVATGADSRARCVQVLAEDGFECETAENPEAAVRVLRQRPFEFDVIVADVRPDSASSDPDVVDHASRMPGHPAVIALAPLSTGADAGNGKRPHSQDDRVQVLARPVDPGGLSRAVAWALLSREVAYGGAPKDRAALYRLATEAQTATDAEQLAGHLVDACLALLLPDRVSVMLAALRPDGDAELRLVAEHGVGVQRRDATKRFGEGVSGWVAQHRRALHLVGPANLHPQFRQLEPDSRIAESLVAPLVCQGTVYGIVSLGNSARQTYGANDLIALACLADIVAAGIHRQRVDRTREHQDRLALLGRLLADVSHELRNPLSVVSALGENLGLIASSDRTRPLPELREELIEMAHDLSGAADRMVAIIETLRSTARRPADRGVVMDVQQLLDRAQSLVAPRFRGHATLVLETGSSPAVRVDAGRILQILLNLLVNAAQAVRGEGRVILRSKTDGSSAVIEVEDNGPGIPDGVASRMFEPFFTTKGEEGTGLGLCISREIARQHGGDLSFTTRPGQGTCFQLRIPAADSVSGGASSLSKPT